MSERGGWADTVKHVGLKRSRRMTPAFSVMAARVDHLGANGRTMLDSKAVSTSLFSADSFRSYLNVPTSAKQGQCPKLGHPHTAAPRISQKWAAEFM
jgi:hypothetical protein